MKKTKLYKKFNIKIFIALILFFIVSGKSLAYDENLSEDLSSKIIKLNQISKEEQNSKEANQLRSELTGFSIELIEKFRNGEEPYVNNDAYAYEIVFNDKKNENTKDNVDFYFDQIYQYSQEKNNHLKIKNNFINFGYLEYKITSNIMYSTVKKILSLDKIKNYKIENLRYILK